jgi:hypothetical protein
MATLKVTVHGLQQEVVVCGGLDLFTNTLSQATEKLRKVESKNI